jgi:hypothetical protein
MTRNIGRSFWAGNMIADELGDVAGVTPRSRILGGGQIVTLYSLAPEADSRYQLLPSRMEQGRGSISRPRVNRPQPKADRSDLEGSCVIARGPSMRNRWIAATGEKIAHRNVRLVG